MRKVLLLVFAVLSLSVFAQDNVKEKKLFNGYDGGMMLHAGYVSTNVRSLDYKPEGVTKGIGGAIRFHLGNHYRIGTEGYVSTLGLMDNGSYMKTFWAGLLNDFYWQFGKFMPYVGLTIGCGALTDCFIFEGDNHDWNPETEVVINKEPFFAIDPMIGCEYCLSDAMHLTLKIDFLTGFGSENLFLPMGPRCYIGFIFSH
ncbi:MAG: hypothetical protein IJZ87_08725 [Bacteroidales bacterium]|nr:hypothetical protein [Bacteroidales bacterium]